MTDPIEEMRKQVQDRVEAEAATLPPPNERPKITSKLINECLFANALGDGILYSTLFRDKFVYCENAQAWFEWSGHYWQRDIMNHSLAAVEDVAGVYLAEHERLAQEITESLKAGVEVGSDVIKKLQEKQLKLLKRVSLLRDDNRRTTCLKFAHTIKDSITIKGDEFDSKPMLFPCANGVIDLETGRLKPGRPGDYLSLASPIPFTDIDTPAPLWEKSLLEIFGGNENLVAYLQRLFGYAMTGLVTEKVFPILYGPTGWNGRTLIVSTISHVMGDLAGPISPEMLLAQKYSRSSSAPSPDIMTLKGLRMAFACEIDEGRWFSGSKVKWLTGKDELIGRSPYDKYPTCFAPSHKLFLMTNIQPKAPPNDRAFWERIHLIPFTISFINRDPRGANERRANLNLGQQLVQEYPGILAWLCRGCLLWQQNGLMPPREITDATEQYRRNEDRLADFIDECCQQGPALKEKSSVLYARFVDWYHDNVGKDEPSGTWFGKNLTQKFDKHKSDGGFAVYQGIALKGHR